MRDNIISIGSVDGAEIPAVLHASQDEKHTETCVLLLHGLTTSKDEYQDVYKKLAADLGRRSVCSLRIDFRGHGDSQVPLSDYSVHTQVLDTLSALAYLRSHFPNSRIRMLGTSYGAPPAILSAEISAFVEKVVLLAPILSFDRTFLYPTTPWTEENFGISRYENALKEGLDIGDGFVLGPRLLLDHFIVDPLKHLPSISERCVILHGDQDGMVPYTVSREAVESLNIKKFHTLENTGHGLAEIGDEDRISEQTRKNQALLVEELVN